MTAGAILAGGRSRRFGSDKAAVRLGERTFLEHVARALRGAGLDPLIVVGGSPAGIPPGFVHVPDRWPGQGPLGGILTALHHEEGDMVVAACDLPLLQAATVRHLVASARGDLVTLPVWRGARQPLCALYRAAARGPLAAAFEDGERGLQRALAELAIREVPFDDADPSFTNVNTPEEYLSASRCRHRDDESGR